MADNLIVISSPRSGTHLLLNAIKHNLRPDLVFKSWEYFCPLQQGHPIEEGRPPWGAHEPNLSRGYLIKSHARNLTELRSQIKPTSLIDESSLIYISRDPFGVMRSSYYYYPTWSKRCEDIISSAVKSGQNPFKEFILQSGLLKEWVDSTTFWLSQKNVFCITFNELINDYDKALSRLSLHLSSPLSPNIIQPHESAFNNGAGVISPSLTKNEFKKSDFLDLINSQIERHKNEN